MERELLELDLQLFSEEGEDAGAEESEIADQTEEETTETESEETVEEESGNDEPPKQSDEENARYAAIRRRAEEDARRKYQAEINQMNQQVAAMCQGVTHPTTGQPITNVNEYLDALAIQQRQANEQELQDKGVDPELINRMIASNPVVMQAQQVIEQNKAMASQQQLQNDLAELAKIDPNIKGIQELSELPTFPEILKRVEQGDNLVDAYKIVNFNNFMQHTEGAARQQAINQMRGKSHLQSPSTSVATDSDDVDVPADIMSRWKEDGKSEKQIRELYKKVAGKLHLS